jgi:hypothetical protein
VGGEPFSPGQGASLGPDPELSPGPGPEPEVLPPSAGHLVAVGPEGGWTDRERTLGRPLAVAEQVLRAETAAIAVGSLLVMIRAGLVRPSA